MSLIEKCSQRFQKLKNEGWVVIEQNEKDAILEKNGIRKHIYIANDTSTYKIDDIDSQAFYGTSLSVDDAAFKDDVNTEFSSDQYSYISVDDSNYVETHALDRKVLHRFDTTISEEISDITQIDFTYKGYANNGSTVARECALFVKESGTFTKKDYHNNNTKTTLTAQYQSGFSNIIESSHIHWGVRGERKPSYSTYLYSYYAEIVITYLSTDQSHLSQQVTIRKQDSKDLVVTAAIRRSNVKELTASLFILARSHLWNSLVVTNYVSEGILTSAQLLPPYSKDAIIFESDVTLNGGTVQVQFSDDNVNYYDMNGTLNAWTSLSEGYNLLYITKANLSDKFYYKLKLTKGPSDTPYVDWIKVTYLVPHSASSNINQELNILGIGYADLLDILKIRKSTYSDLLASLIYEKFGSSSLPALLDTQKPSLADIYQVLAVNETWKDITQMLNVQVAGYIDLSGLIDIYYKGISDLSNSLLLRTAGSTDLQNMFGIRRSTYQDMLNSLLLRTFGSTDLLESLTIEQQDAFALPIILDVRRSYFRWLLNQLSLRKSASANLPSTCWVRPYNELSSTATISRRGTIIIPHMLECRHSWWREINGRLVIPLYDGSVDFASSLLLRKRQVSFPKSILSIRRPSGYDISQTLEINKYKFTDIQGQTIVRKHTSADLSSSLITEHYAYLPCTLDVERGNISMLVGTLDIKQTDSSEIVNTLSVASENYGDLISSLAISKQQYTTLPCTAHVGREVQTLQNTIVIRKEDYSALPSIFTLRRLNQNDLLSELEIRSRIYNDIYNEMILRNQLSSDLVNQISLWSKSILDGQLMIERVLKRVSIEVEKPSIKIEVMKI